MSDKLRIIVGGLVGQYPLGGVAWDYFHYLLALHEQGHDVYYHEDTWTWPHHPISGYPVDDPSYTLAFFRDFFRQHAPDLAEKWCYVLLHDKHYGMSKEAFADVAKTADVYLNVSGACFLPDELNPHARRVFLDTDPGYNQVILAHKPSWSENAARWEKQVREEHDRHLTYAENIGQADCRVPTCGIDWKVTRPVVSLPAWEAARAIDPPPKAPFTTVMTWNYFKGPVEHEGVEYFQKTTEFEKCMDLPGKTQANLELAVGGERFDPKAMAAKGWSFVRALPASVTPGGYRDYITCCAGEWSVAKNVYVGMRTGWFSCRTACYLAAGRPAVVQDTGWSKTLPSDAGCLAFETVDEAAAGLDAVLVDYGRHRAAAYDFAREHLAADRVLPPMLDAIG
jgi:hypothetical protein